MLLIFSISSLLFYAKTSEINSLVLHLDFFTAPFFNFRPIFQIYLNYLHIHMNHRRSGLLF